MVSLEEEQAYNMLLQAIQVKMLTKKLEMWVWSYSVNVILKGLGNPKIHKTCLSFFLQYSLYCRGLELNPQDL